MVAYDPKRQLRMAKSLPSTKFSGTKSLSYQRIDWCKASFGQTSKYIHQQIMKFQLPSSNNEHGKPCIKLFRCVDRELRLFGVFMYPGRFHPFGVLQIGFRVKLTTPNIPSNIGIYQCSWQEEMRTLAVFLELAGLKFFRPDFTEGRDYQSAAGT